MKKSAFTHVRAINDRELSNALTNHTHVIINLVHGFKLHTRTLTFLFWWVLVASAAIIWLAVR